MVKWKVETYNPYVKQIISMKVRRTDIWHVLRIARLLTNIRTCLHKSQVGLYFNCPALSLHEYLSQLLWSFYVLYVQIRKDLEVLGYFFPWKILQKKAFCSIPSSPAKTKSSLSRSPCSNGRIIIIICILNPIDEMSYTIGGIIEKTRKKSSIRYSKLSLNLWKSKEGNKEGRD